MEFYRLRFNSLLIGTHASGRKPPFDSLDFRQSEQPLWVKADGPIREDADWTACRGRAIQ